MIVADLMDRIDANPGTHRSASEGRSAMHRIEAAAIFRRQHEVGALCLVKSLLQADPGSSQAHDSDVTLKLADTRGVGGIPPLRPLIPTGGGAGEPEGEAADIATSSFLGCEGR